MDSSLYVYKDNTFWKANFALFDRESKKYEFLYFSHEGAGSFTIWNSVIFMYFDKKLVKCKSFDSNLSERYHGQILWADLRHFLDFYNNSNEILVFHLLLKGKKDLIGRAITADDEGIYLLGGSYFSSNESKLEYSNNCNFYSLKNNKLSTISSMSLRRDNLIAISTQKNLFVASGFRHDLELKSGKLVNFC